LIGLKRLIPEDSFEIFGYAEGDNSMSYAVSWSGGKDSCFALYRAVLSGYRISHLVNFINKESKRVSFHGTEAKLIQSQAEAIDITLTQKETNGEQYEEKFKEAVRSLISEGVEGMIFGDIYLEEHKKWTKRVCEDLEIKAVEPLWGKDPEKILIDFINAGFEAIIISAKSELFGEKWIGKKVDEFFLNYLKNNSIDLCGENGEYHTLVSDGPFFKKKIKINKARSIMKDNYWFLDIFKHSL